MLEARREVQWALLKGGRDPWTLPAVTWTWDGPVEGKKATQGVCMIQFGRQGFRIRLSNLLRRIEGMILTNPTSLGALQANLAGALAPKDVVISTRPTTLTLADDDRFLAARSRLFTAIRGNDGQGTVETADLLTLRAEIVSYASEYHQLLRDGRHDVAEDPRRWTERVGLAAIDTVRLTLPGLSDQSSVAIMLAPTHPLRMLWQLQLALLGDAWLKEAELRGSFDALSVELRETLQGGIAPLNLPPVLFDHRRVSYLQAGPVSPGWDVYLPSDIEDKASALARLARAVNGGRAPIDRVTLVDLGDRVLRYLKQHPYIEQLRINVFNPGDGAVIADLLEHLDSQYTDLRYDIRLFSHDNVRDDLGVALDRLVNPEITVGESAEKYSQAGIYPLHPNLSYSKNRIAEFLASPHEYEAHLSILVDVFHPRVDVAEPFTTETTSSLFGLVQEEGVQRRGEQGAFAWERQVIAGPTREITDGAMEASLLGETLGEAQRFIAALGAGPSTNSRLTPTVRLDLSVQGQNLLFEVHRASDWVLTIDRHLGIDYFDSAAQAASTTSPGILLDFAPEYPSTDRAVLMLTTRVDQEIDRLVTPALQRLGLDGPNRAERIVEWLRSLSGRLAMRLMMAPLASQGVIGMALARAFLSRMGVLRDTIVIPCDAHIGLLQRGVSTDASKSRTDLILARRVDSMRQIEFTLIEVKCTASHMTASEFQALRAEMEEQVAATQMALAALFDPNNQVQDRLDRPLRNLLLRRLLQFYIGRARRYGLMEPSAERDFLALIGDLDAGYAVSFRQLGLIFELGRDDDGDEMSGDLPVHRVGRRSCEKLLSGDDETELTPPGWDRLRTTIRGSAIWTRPAGKPEETPSPPQSDSGQRSALPESGSELANEGLSSLREDSTRNDQHADVSEPRSQPNLKPPTYGYLVGASAPTPQWGVIGKRNSDVIALDLDGCNTLSIFGVQGGGKSYSMGSILEMAVRQIPGLNVLPKPMAAVVFHYNESQDYAPEFVSMAQPNRVVAEVTRLRDEYGASPLGIDDILVLVPGDKVAQRRQEFPGLTVEPIAFHPAELTIQDWRFLMGAVGNDSLYIKELNLVMRALRDNITVADLRQGIEDSHMSEAQRKLARLRLRFAEQFVHDGPSLRDKLRPGRLVVVDLRDELIETDEALGLFVVMLRVFAGATYEGRPFNKWIAFDEAHKYIRNTELVDSVVSVIRQMRHQGTSVLIASQDPLSLPLRIIELSSLVLLHRMDSPGWLKHIQKAVTALGDLTPPALASLRPGEAYLWARAATDAIFTRRAVKIECRPRATQHGGATRSATEE